MSLETLIFDLDGTISDPFIGISRSVNYALEALNFEPVDSERVRPHIGPPLDEIFETLLGEQPVDVMRQLVDKYRERYADVGFAENAMYPEISTVIAELARSGYRLGICTSKRADYARAIVELFGLGEHFSFVDGGDIGVSKIGQIAALIDNGLSAEGAAMIGDRSVDIDAGNCNELTSVGVLWGFGGRSELERANPNHLVASPAELRDLFLN